MQPKEHGPAGGVKWGLALVALLIGLLWLWHGALLWGGQVLCGGDIVNRFVPMRISQLQHGWFSAWQPETFSGRPMAGNIEAGVFYPPNWLMILWRDPAPVTTLLTMLHLAFGAVGFYFLARLWMRPAAAALSAFLWAFGGAQVLRLTHGVVIFNFSFAWLPWIVLAAWKQGLARGPGLRWTALLAFFGAMQLLAGAAQVVQIAWFGVAVITVVRAWTERHASSPWRTLGGAVLAGVLMLLLAAPALSEAMRFQRESFPRGGEDRWTFLSDGSLHPRVLLTMAWPELYGPGSLEVQRFGPAPPGQPAYAVEEYLGYWGSEIGYHETNAYLGVGALLLALFGGWSVTRRGGGEPAPRAVALSLLILLAVGLWLSLGKHGGLFRAFVAVVPTFDFFRVPSRWLLWPVASLCLLAGFGLDRLLGRDEDDDPPMKPWLACCAVVVGVALLGRLVLPGGIESLGVSRAFITVPPDRYQEAMESLRGFSTGAATWALLMVLLAAGLGTALLAGRVPRQAGIVLLLLILAVDLRRFWVPFTEAMPHELSPVEIPTETPYHRIDAEAFHDHFYPESELVQFLDARGNKGRVHYTETLNSFHFDEHQREFFAERPMARGIEVTRGYQALQLKGYVEDYYASLAPVGKDWSNAFLTQMDFRDRRFLDAYNVTEVLSYDFPQVGQQLAALGLDGKQRVTVPGVFAWNNPHARGWAWLSKDREFLDAEPAAELGAVELEERSANLWRGRVRVASAPAVLHLSTPYYSAFTLTALLDGREVSGLDSRTVELDAVGEWTFERRARGMSKPALALSVLALLGLLALVAVSRRERGTTGDTARD